ncbi:testis-expressed protein 15 isoform X2 [Engystomops pustulosus]|uniref:testis-expressed protein 15 isoform X2 n=1 Tax=Engystomops pustulosus TaxID=76066 RepID=UPI003AFA0AC2
MRVADNMEEQVKTSSRTTHAESKHLQNFTIPKIKRTVDKSCLLRCMPNRREFGDILETLNNGRLNIVSELKSTWAFSEMKLVINEYLTEKFFEKRNEMKELGRHSRELEYRFCFLVVPTHTANDIALHGLSVGSMAAEELGNPEMGVYLFRYIDVALNFAHQKKMSSNVVLIFKVLFGKVKTVKPGSALKSVLEPTPNFDSHISKKAPLWNDPLDEQVTNSLIYVYEYDKSFKPVKTPRQCLPIATVDATFIVNKTVTATLPARQASKPIVSGDSTPANCTVAQRIGKGKDAMVIFKSIRSPLAQTTGIETIQNNVFEKEAPSVPVTETEPSCCVLKKSPLFQNNITLPDLSISLEQNSVALESLITSCMVITSKSMKDPRLVKRSEPETTSPVGQQNDCSVFPENEVSCVIEKNLNTEIPCYSEDSFVEQSLYLSFEEKRVYDSFLVTEEPLVKGLNKYSSFLTCGESERDSDIKSSPNIHTEEKAEHSMKMNVYDQLLGLSASQFGNESKETEFSISMSLKTLNCTSGHEEKPDGNRLFFKNLDTPEKDSARSIYFSLEGEAGNELLPNTLCKEQTEILKKVCSNDKLGQISPKVRTEKEKSLLNASSLVVEVVDSMPLNTSNNIKTNTKVGKSEGHRRMSLHKMLKNKANLKTTNLMDCYKEQSLSYKKHPLVESSLVTSKTKLLKKSKECILGLKQKLYGPGKDRISKAVTHQTSKKVTQNKKSPMEPDATDKLPAVRTIVLNDKKPTSIADKCLHKFISTAAVHERLTILKSKDKCHGEKSPEKERHELYLPKAVTDNAREYKKVHTAAPKQIILDRHGGCFTPGNLTNGSGSKTVNEKDSSDLHSSNKINTRVQENSHFSQISSLIIPTNANPQSSDLDEAVKKTSVDKVVQDLCSKKIKKVAMTIPKTTHKDVSGENICFVTELENRIDWSGIFGMELDKVDEMLGTLRCSSVSQEKEPSGLRIFPDMEITITNNHYVCADGTSHSIIGEMQVSSKAQGDLNKALKVLNDPQDQHVTDSSPSIQIPNGSPALPKSENSLKDRLNPLSLKLDNSVQSRMKTVADTNLNGIKTLHKQNSAPLKRRLNKKKMPSVPVKRSSRRIHKFSQSEENIKVVLGMLSDEIPLCKNKRISKKLDRAILHLRKAHKRVKKSLQLAAKAGKRRNLDKSCNVQENLIFNGNKVNSKPVEITSIKLLQPDDSSPKVIAAEMQKTDKKFLTESTQVMINGASMQDSQQTKVIGSSPSKMSLSPTCKVTVSLETPEDHSSNFTAIVSNKENTIPMDPSLQAPTDETEKHAVNCETSGKDFKSHNGRKRHSSKHMFSHIRKQRTSLAMSISKGSSKKINENEKKLQRNKEFATITFKVAKTSSLLLSKLSKILQKASETDSLKLLQNLKLMCKNIIPAFIKAFEKKQDCGFKKVIVDRRLFVKQNLKTCFKCPLKPQAVEAFLELQMILETRQFVENRIHFIEGKPTFRSLLWYDGSLYAELLTGEFGYQQQSPFYSAFQEKLRLNPLTTVKNHYTQLSEYLQEIDETDSSYYVYLKYKRELQECEDVLKRECDHAAFSLSIPFSCGVHLGDTIDDLTALQKSTLEVIGTLINLPNCDPGKKEHALSLLEVISAKIDYIKTSVTTSMQLSLFGIEHLLFDAAKAMACHETNKCGGQTRTITKGLINQINSIALSKLYEVYCAQSEQPVNIKKSSSEILNSYESSEYFGKHDVFYFGKAIDKARCAEPGVLKKMIHDCKLHLEFQSKYFQILQECIVDEVLIQETNALDMAENPEKCTILLKPEAVEAYIDLAMTYETLHFLNCLMALKKNQERTRGLLWYDASLFSDLIQHQYRVQSFLEGNILPTAIDIIDGTISEIKSELDVISSCSNSVNYTYAFQIMTRELSELSELKSFMTSKPAIATYINCSPFVVSLYYGNSLGELSHNYNQLSHYLGILLSAPKKDLGKLAHTMKIMKTIELSKVLLFKPGTSRFSFITCHVLHNRKKQNLAIKGKIPKEEHIITSQYPRKRINTKVPADEDSSSPKKQKVITSHGKTSKKKREENQVLSDLRPGNLFEIFTTGPQQNDRLPIAKDSVNGSTQKNSKSLLPRSSKCTKVYGISATEIKIYGKDDKTSPPGQDKIKIDPFVGKCKETSGASVTTEFTLDSKNQSQEESKCVKTPSPESIISNPVSEDINNIQENKVIDELSKERDPSVDENSSILSVCSMDLNTPEEQENIRQLNSTPGKQEEIKKKQSPTSNEEIEKSKSTTWNSQSVLPASGQYPQFPVSTTPWQYSLYGWYQNSNNTGGITQGYPCVSYNTQSENPYNRSSAFTVPNALQYSRNQPYSTLSGQIQAGMFSVSGSFGANVPYDYTASLSSSNQNPVPIPYSYNSNANTGWPWDCWQ